VKSNKIKGGFNKAIFQK